MKITRSDSQKLVIEDFPYALGALAFSGAVVLLWCSVSLLVEGTAKKSEALGAFLGFLLCFSFGSVMAKRSVFEFDLVSRQLTWKRRGLFCRKGGTIPFDEIESANPESPKGGSRDGSPTYRLVLKTKNGVIPLTDSYSGEWAQKREDEIRAQINAILKPATIKPL